MTDRSELEFGECGKSRGTQVHAVGNLVALAEDPDPEDPVRCCNLVVVLALREAEHFRELHRDVAVNVVESVDHGIEAVDTQSADRRDVIGREVRSDSADTHVRGVHARARDALEHREDCFATIERRLISCELGIDGTPVLVGGGAIEFEHNIAKCGGSRTNGQADRGLDDPGIERLGEGGSKPAMPVDQRQSLLEVADLQQFLVTAVRGLDVEPALCDDVAVHGDFNGEVPVCQRVQWRQRQCVEPMTAVRKGFGAPVEEAHGASVGPLLQCARRYPVQSISLDLESPDVVRDPYPYFDEWRQAGTALYHEGLGMHLAFRYDDANAVLRSKALGRIWQDKQPDDLWHTFNWLHSDSILESEPPKHTRLRALVAKAFLRGQIERLRPAVQRIADELLDAAIAKQEREGHFDLIADYAEPLPVAIIAELLGVPEDQRENLRPWSQQIVKMYDYNKTAEDERLAQIAADEFSSFMKELADERRRHPGDDLLTHLAQVEAEGERLNERELVATGVLILNAGHEASVNGFGNGAVQLFRHPEQLAALAADPWGLVDTAIEEMLRFDSPLHLFERTAKTDTVVAGVEIKEGQKIAALLGSANRDPEAFTAADTFDIRRDPNNHIAFGAGIHFCLGAPLARLELSVTVPRLLERLPNLQLAGEPVQRDTFVLRGYHSIPVRG